MTVRALILALFAWLEVAPMQTAQGQPSFQPVLVIHGGATGRPKEKMTPAMDQHAREGLRQALLAGYKVLDQSNGSSLVAVEEAVRVLEDSPWFNAGKGAVFSREGRNELDAAIMDGATRRAGAVAGVTRLKNPITGARLVMEKSEHVLMIGPGAERFTIAAGAEEVSPVYFWTPERWQQLQEDIAKLERQQHGQADMPLLSYGTVGAVAVDRHGRLAAATSTGGTSYKRPGRVGDTPVIGAGTFADDRCAVSGTGHGEVFIRFSVAHDVAARVRYKAETLDQAATAVIKGLPAEPGGAGGLIAVDREGHVSMPYVSLGMLRGVAKDGHFDVAIYEK
jgi:beta-aspartyl-peptidase (threonine type)